MTFIRILLTAAEIVGCAAAVYLGSIDQPGFGIIVAAATVLLAWAEGFHGWGSSYEHLKR